MSKNIVIQEGGVGKQLTANKLKTNLVGGGTCLWVPEDETRLGTKHISEDGTYKASDDGYYGYSEVTVSGIGTATGKDPDGSGDDATATVDPETGEIVVNKLPNSIRVDTPPSLINYTDGATIDFTGMVVKGYLKSGSLWTDKAHPDGIIPISELTLPVTKADADQVESESASDTDYDYSFVLSQPIYFSTSGCQSTPVAAESGYYGSVSKSSGGTVYFVAVKSSETNKGFMFISDRPFVLNSVGVYYGREYSNEITSKSYTAKGVTVYYEQINYSDTNSFSPSPHALIEAWGSYAAWELLHIIQHKTSGSGGGQKIPVQWTRPGDYSTLESSFNITVA